LNHLIVYLQLPINIRGRGGTLVGRGFESHSSRHATDLG